MEELIKRLERVIQTGVPDKDGQHPISAEAVLEVVKELSELSTNLAEVGTDCISRWQAIDAVRAALLAWSYMPEWRDNKIIAAVKQLPPANNSEIPNSSDTISRQAAIDALDGEITVTGRANAEAVRGYARLVADRLKRLPSAHPEIIRCRECKFASGDSRICMKFDHSPIGELDFCSFAERRTE